MEKVRFGPAGNSKIFYDAGNKKSTQAPAWLKSVGLNAYEYSFGRGFTMGMAMAKELGEEAKKNDIFLSVHAPYYINLANPSDEMAEKSFNYVFKAVEYLKVMQGKKICIHLASQGKAERQDALDLTKKRLTTLMQKLRERFDLTGIYLCPETMGKFMQIGNEKEVVDLCMVDEALVPTFDFGHINCLRQGALKTEQDYQEIFDYAIEKLGYDRVKNCHIHFSKIEYGAKGEIRHLNLDDQVYGPEFEELAKVLVKNNLTPTIISESATKMAEDALQLKQIYDNVRLELQN